VAWHAPQSENVSKRAAAPPLLPTLILTLGIYILLAVMWSGRRPVPLCPLPALLFALGLAWLTVSQVAGAPTLKRDL